MNTHFEMRMHMKQMSIQERKEFLWAKGYSIEQAEDYLDWIFKGEEEPPV